jgi:DNA mismatch endonuclease (patch repair protein)
VSRSDLFIDVPDKTRAIMRAVRSEGTKPELITRRTLHAMGYRFRIQRRDLPGSPDIILPKYRTAIFVHGCFSHQHLGCKHGRPPRQRTDYWLPKLARTKERDQIAVSELEKAGWRVLIIWECSTSDRAGLSNLLGNFLGERNVTR